MQDVHRSSKNLKRGCSLKVCISVRDSRSMYPHFLRIRDKRFVPSFKFQVRELQKAGTIMFSCHNPRTTLHTQGNQHARKGNYTSEFSCHHERARRRRRARRHRTTSVVHTCFVRWQMCLPAAKRAAAPCLGRRWIRSRTRPRTLMAEQEHQGPRSRTHPER